MIITIGRDYSICEFVRQPSEKDHNIAVIIGGNRGIGLEFVRQHLEEGYDVIATYRSEASLEELNRLRNRFAKQLFLYQLEITDEEAVVQFSRTVKKVNRLILNAGIKGYSGRNVQPIEHSATQLLTTFKTNALAHDTIIRAFSRVILENRTFVIGMGSLVGLTSQNTSGGSHPYRISKAAFEMVLRNWDVFFGAEWLKSHPETPEKRPRVITLCAGWVKTDMGGLDARLTPTESVSQMMQVIKRVENGELSDGLYMYNSSIPSPYDPPDFLKGKSLSPAPSNAQKLPYPHLWSQGFSPENVLGAGFGFLGGWKYKNHFRSAIEFHFSSVARKPLRLNLSCGVPFLGAAIGWVVSRSFKT